MDLFATNGLVQFYQQDIPNYWQYAQTFTLADNFFSMAKGASFPNQLFLIAAQNIVSLPILNHFLTFAL